MLFSGDKKNAKISNSKMEYLQKQSLYWEHRQCMFHTNSYNNDKAMKKPNFPYKDSIEFNGKFNSMDNFNEYSSFLTSKTYSNVSNSILSYIVGGFVGSKSQMNNNKKHILSYDLSAAISNLLNPWKYENEKSTLMANNDNIGTSSKWQSENYSKYILNNSKREAVKEMNRLSDAVDIECLIALPLKELADHQMSTSNCSKNFGKVQSDEKSQVMNNLSNLKAFNSNNVICLNSTKCPEMNNYKGTCETLFRDEKKFEGCSRNFDNKSKPLVNVPDKEESNSCLARHKSSSSLSCCNSESESTRLDVCDVEIASNKRGEVKHSSNFLATQRFRNQSECSVESTDSDSFIMFDDHADDVYDGTQNKPRFHLMNDIDINNSEDGCDDEEEDEDDEEYNDSDESCSSDECDFYPVNKNVMLANEKWLRNYNDVTVSHDECEKKVKFNKNVQVNKIVAWDYAYRTARLGPWEQLARDRVRFQERISRLSFVISPILESNHRKRIYEKYH